MVVNIWYNLPVWWGGVFSGGSQIKGCTFQSNPDLHTYIKFKDNAYTENRRSLFAHVRLRILPLHLQTVHLQLYSKGEIQNLIQTD